MKPKAHELAILVLLLLLASASRASASVLPQGGKMVNNPRTGKPIVQQGTRKLSHEELAILVAKHGFSDQAKAVALATRESGGWVDVVVDTRGMTPEELRAYWGKPALPELSVGLWQINVLANTQFDADALKDPDANAAAALALSHGGTAWGPW